MYKLYKLFDRLFQRHIGAVRLFTPAPGSPDLAHMTHGNRIPQNLTPGFQFIHPVKNDLQHSHHRQHQKHARDPPHHIAQEYRHQRNQCIDLYLDRHEARENDIAVHELDRQVRNDHP